MKLWFLLLSNLISASALAAACCGGGSASPAIISSDDAAQFSASYSFTDVVVDNVDSQGYWRRFENHQSVQTYRLQGAKLISDRWQVGLGVPVVQRNRLGVDHSGLGDITATLAYESIPDWDYNPFRPKGISYLELVLPSGYSRYESDNGGLDSRGNGFWAVGAGMLFLKTFGNFDALVNLEAHRSFSKSVRTEVLSGIATPGFGGNATLGAGYSYGDWRLGGAVQWTVEDPVDLVSDDGTHVGGAVERYATTALSLSYMVSEHWSGNISYLDQTWFGSPTNTSLGRGVALLVQRRWAR